MGGEFGRGRSDGIRDVGDFWLCSDRRERIARSGEGDIVETFIIPSLPLRVVSTKLQHQGILSFHFKEKRHICAIFILLWK